MLLSLLLLHCSAASNAVRPGVCPDGRQHPAPAASKTTPIEATPPALPIVAVSTTVTNEQISRSAFTQVGQRPKDPSCEPRLSPELAQILYETANRLIELEGEHLSNGAAQVILPLLRLASHSGNQQAQRRYGYYVIGYYMTDEMFWPRQKEIAADALAMLHVVAIDAPQMLGDDGAWAISYTEPSDEKKLFPTEWVKRAKLVEAFYRKCLGLEVQQAVPEGSVRNSPQHNGPGG